jgi:hypothetical protein
MLDPGWPDFLFNGRLFAMSSFVYTRSGLNFLVTFSAVRIVHQVWQKLLGYILGDFFADPPGHKTRVVHFLHRMRHPVRTLASKLLAWTLCGPGGPGLPDGIFSKNTNIIIKANFGEFCNGKYWYMLCPCGPFVTNSVQFMAIWSILRQFGIFYSHLVYFSPILVCFIKTNLANQRWSVFLQCSHVHRWQTISETSWSPNMSLGLLTPAEKGFATNRSLLRF